MIVKVLGSIFTFLAIATLLNDAQGRMETGQTEENNLEPVFDRYAGKYKPKSLTKKEFKKLLKSLAWVESSMNPNANSAFAPDSYGIMQVICRSGENGVDDSLLGNWIDGWPPESCNDLFNADLNIKIGAQIIAWNIQTYGFDPEKNWKSVAAYNAASAQNPDVPKSADPQDFPNPDYVRKVKKEWFARTG